VSEVCAYDCRPANLVAVARPPGAARRPTMMLPQLLTTIIAAAAAATGAAAAAPVVPRGRAVLHVVCDDLGYNDVSWRNPAIATPHLAALREGGIVLEHYYTFQVCGPSRSSILSGRYPQAAGYYGNPSDNQIAVPLNMSLTPAVLVTGGVVSHAIGKVPLDPVGGGWFLHTERLLDTERLLLLFACSGMLAFGRRCTRQRSGASPHGLGITRPMRITSTTRTATRGSSKSIARKRRALWQRSNWASWPRAPRM
jgi:hypothetical protein